MEKGATWRTLCLVPRPHYSARPKRFGSRGPGENVRPRQKSSKVRQKWDSSMAMVNKTRVSHFKVKNTLLKHTDGRGNFKRMLSFLQVDRGRLFFIKLSFEDFKIHEIFIMVNRSAWPVLKRHQVAKFLKNFQVNFVLCSQESDVFGNVLS